MIDVAAFAERPLSDNERRGCCVNPGVKHHLPVGGPRPNIGGSTACFINQVCLVSSFSLSLNLSLPLFLLLSLVSPPSLLLSFLCAIRLHWLVVNGGKRQEKRTAGRSIAPSTSSFSAPLEKLGNRSIPSFQ